MKRILREIFITTLMILSMCGVVYAKNKGGFNFEMVRSAGGATNFSLSANTATVKVNGNTYKYSDGKKADPLKYQISLYKKGGSIGKYQSLGKADGKEKSVSFTINKKGTYKVNLVVTNQDPSGTVYRYVKGSGNVSQ